MQILSKEIVANRFSCPEVGAQASNPYTRERGKVNLSSGLVYKQEKEGVKWKLQVGHRLICKGSIWVDHSSTMLIKQRFPKVLKVTPCVLVLLCPNPHENPDVKIS